MASTSKNTTASDSDSDYDESNFTFSGKKSSRKTNDDREGVENAWDYKIPPFSKGDMKHKLIDTTEFTEKFPEYRGPYIKECFPVLKKLLQNYGITVVLSMEGGSLHISTTENTWDPYAIMIARDMLRLVCRSVPIEKAERLFDDGITSEIIKINNMVSDTKVFVKRRQRLLGRDNATLKAVETLLDANMFVQGGTVSVIAPYRYMDNIATFVKKVMKNVHPLYLLNQLDVKCSLQKNESAQNSNWAPLLPSYTAKKINKKKKKKRVAKEYNPLPPAPLESKLDKQLAEGEYFVSDDLKKPLVSKSEQKLKSIKKQGEKRNKQYEVPREASYPDKKKRKLEQVDASSAGEVDVAQLIKKVKTHKKKLSTSGVPPLPSEKPKKSKDKKAKSKDKKSKNK